MELKLLRPNVSFKEIYQAGFAELSTDSDRLAWIYMGDDAPFDLPARDFRAYVDTLLQRQSSPPAGWVPDIVYWAISQDKMVGRISLRCELNDFLKKIAGHIGYIVAPSARGQGVASEMLRQILETKEARQIGRMLLTCDETNLASEKTILKNGGQFESMVDMGAGRPRKKRFWIGAG